MASPAAALSSCPLPQGVRGGTTTRYKGLGRGAQSIFGGRACWSLPICEAPGAWMPPVEHLSPGAAGYHLCGAGDLLCCWLAPRLFVAEGRGASVATPAGAAIAFQEARLLRELPWDLGVAVHFYGECLEHAVAEARRHVDYVDERHHCRLLADLRSWRGDEHWPDVVRLGLADLAVAVGDLWHRADRRRRDAARHPRQTYLRRAQERQVRRFVACLGAGVPDAQEAPCA